jgi:chromosome segregation protein
MKIKRLEIQGFKSFKDKTVIHFDHCITGIVGPNGCGKSNIVDAFFWVMGEQSYKHMRGSGSEDLIFNGSAKYSSLGMAEATLVMEMEVVDGVISEPSFVKTKEIAVTRRVYRSGEGEYFINGALSRLKDIQELFMDTGVGAKGYSVIEQGQIGKVVNAKPEDRRLLIEEAAGIAKYKARKKESLRKMEATEANLARLSDIIQEIEKSLVSLEKQAQKAKLYQKHKTDLFEKEMLWGRHKRAIFQAQCEALSLKKEACEIDALALKTHLQTVENTLEADRVLLVTDTKDAEALQLQIQQFAELLAEKKSALDLSRRRQMDLDSQLESLDQEKKDLQASLFSLEEEVGAKAQQLQETEEHFKQASNQGKLLQTSSEASRLALQKTRAFLDTQQRRFLEGLEAQARLKSQIAGFESKVESVEEQQARLSEQISLQVSKVTEIQQECHEHQEAFKKFTHTYEALLQEKKEEVGALQAQEQILGDLESQQQSSLRKVTQLKSKLQSFEEMDHAHEGMADAPKQVLEWARQDGLPCSAFTDFIQIQSGYEAVLESFLESKIEYLVMTGELPWKFFDQLQKEKRGRVGLVFSAPSPCMPESSFEQVEIFLNQQGFEVLGPLRSFLHIDANQEASFSSWFQKVCLVKSMLPWSASLLPGLQGWSLVSQDGVVCDAIGVMRGGSLSTTGATGILKRKRSIQQLQKEVLESESAHALIEQDTIRVKQKVVQMRIRVQALSTELQDLEVQRAGVQRDVHQTQKALESAQAHEKYLRQEASQLARDEERFLEEKQEFEEKLQEIVSSHLELQSSVEESQEELSKKQQSFELEEEKLQSWKLQEASLQERTRSLKREWDAAKSLLSDRTKRMEEVSRILHKASSEQEEFSGGEGELQDALEHLTLELGQVREKLAEVKERMQQAQNRMEELLENSKNFHQKREEKASASNQLAIELEKISGELQHLVLNLEEKYGADCWQQEPQELGSWSAEKELILNEEVEKLRERLRRLGEVNMMAIEEYEEFKKRYDHLIHERNDLQSSLKNLQDAIEHINQTSKERFEKAFEAISDRFERLFPIIFGGGQSKLSLVYPEGSRDILEAGVDILAQPPGKKVANITLLSGGEKALTAVSLIFAIFMVKPSPFCVLDEVDAPLDDANIGKFNALLREMSVKSQFILITHNKKTMELNDTLYGVTMEEPGVSKMVSIQMH